MVRVKSHIRKSKRGRRHRVREHSRRKVRYYELDFGKGKLVPVSERAIHTCYRCGGYKGQHKKSCLFYGQESVYRKR